MYADRRSGDFIKGVHSFLNVAETINLDMSLTKIYSHKVCEAAIGTNLCAYYACENLRALVNEGINFQTVSEQYTDKFIYCH
jgi:hypothetical protein